MSALEIFRLQPGQELRYTMRSSGPADGSMLEVRRPDEGVSPELCLRLLDPLGQPIGAARIRLADGYLAVARALRGWIQQAGFAEAEFDLEPLRAGGGAVAAN